MATRVPERGRRNPPRRRGEQAAERSTAPQRLALVRASIFASEEGWHRVTEIFLGGLGEISLVRALVREQLLLLGFSKSQVGLISAVGLLRVTSAMRW